MSELTIPSPGAGALRARRRSLTDPALRIRESALGEPDPYAAVFEPAVEGVDPIGWAAESRPLLDDRLARFGAVLLRGFELASVDDFERLVAAAGGAPLEYEDQTSPRSEVQGHIYTSTDFPPDQRIFLHNENSYSWAWPRKILFYCVEPAEEGGRTPIADCRRVYGRLPEDLRHRFEERGVAYVRNFGDGLGLPWQKAFGSERREEVEDFCRRHRIEWEWKPGDRLRTRQVRGAVLRHPDSGEPCWFNQVPLFHVAMLEPEVRDGLLAEFAPEDLPSNVVHGDGSPIGEDDLATICAAYDAEERSFEWRRGDVLLLDNVRVAHGRTAYRGRRRVVVGMAEPATWAPASG